MLPNAIPGGFSTFKEGILRLKPSLERLAQKTTVVWLQQYPAIDLYGATNADNTDIHNQKIFQYNERVKKMFR